MRGVALLAVLGLVACDYPEERFADEVARATCDFARRCWGDTPPIGFGQYAQCDGEGAEADPTLDCAYDQVQAQDCVSGVDEMECPETDAQPVWPWACDQVYRCP